MRSASCQTDGGARQSLGIYLVEQIILFLRLQQYLIVVSNPRAQLPGG